MIMDCVALMSSIDVKCCEDTETQKGCLGGPAYGVQDTARNVLPPVYLNEVSPEVLRYLFVGVGPISVRRDAKTGAVIEGSKVSDIRSTHYFLTLIPDSSFFLKRSAYALSVDISDNKQFGSPHLV